MVATLSDPTDWWMLFSTVRAVVVRRNGQKAHVVAIPVRSTAARLSDAQRVNGIYAGGRLDAHYLFPFQPAVTVGLVPGQLTNFFQRVQRSMSVSLLEVEQMLLKNRVVQVKADKGLVVSHQRF